MDSKVESYPFTWPHYILDHGDSDENKQNDRVYLPKRSAENLHLRLATRNHAPSMVVDDGRSPFVFIDNGVEMNAEYYRKMS